MLSLEDAKAKGRDAKRFQDIKQVENSLALYYDKYGHYPMRDDNGRWSALNVLVDEGFLSSLPKDPKQPSSCPETKWIADCHPNVYYYWEGKPTLTADGLYCNGLSYGQTQYYVIRYHREKGNGNWVAGYPNPGYPNPGCPIGPFGDGDNAMISAVQN